MRRPSLRQYAANWRAWAAGWRRFDEITFKPGWSGDSLAWRALYLLDYGTHVAAGGAVVSWSRWAHEERGHRVPGLLDRLLNALDRGHGAAAGPALWGTVSAWGAA